MICLIWVGTYASVLCGGQVYLCEVSSPLIFTWFLRRKLGLADLQAVVIEHHTCLSAEPSQWPNGFLTLKHIPFGFFV